MCMFSFDPRKSPAAAPIHVVGTRIFARGLADGMQVLVYSMRYTSQVDMAMVLPLPTPPDPGEDAAAFVDLSHYAEFFDHMDLGFPEFPREFETLTLSVGRDGAGARRPLVVHDVGSFEASFIPSQADFIRLDPRFRLPEEILDQLPAYRDFAFAVFKLKPGSKKTHPIAFTFPRRNRGELFFPTVHVHDGTAPPQAVFDHFLYCQGGDTGSSAWQTSYRWTTRKWVELNSGEQEMLIAGKMQEFRSMYRNIDEQRARQLAIEDTFDVQVPIEAGRFMRIGKVPGLLAEDALIARLRLRGLHENKDTIVAQAA